MERSPEKNEVDGPDTVPAVSVVSTRPQADLGRSVNFPHGPASSLDPGPGSAVSPRPARDSYHHNNYGSLSWTQIQRPRGNEDDAYQYEEFFGGTIQCPSCRGVGRIPREKENELVALIPFSDQRLKPRRTVLYVILAVLICIVIGSLLLFFLFPRSVKLESNISLLIPTERYVNETEQYVFLSVVNVFNVSNHNFYNIQVDQMSVLTLYDKQQISVTHNDTSMKVPMRQKRSYSIHINMTFSGPEGYVADYCAGKHAFSGNLLIPFQVTMTSKALGRSEESTMTAYQWVFCGEPN